MLRWNKGLQPAIHSRPSAECETAPRLLSNSRALADKKLTSVAAFQGPDAKSGASSCKFSSIVGMHRIPYHNPAATACARDF
jgi:hypothetical protein